MLHISFWPTCMGLQNSPTASPQRRKIPPPQCVSWYDHKQSAGETPVMLELWGMPSTFLLPSFPVLLWPVEVAPNSVLSMGQIELNCVLMLNLIA